MSVDGQRYLDSLNAPSAHAPFATGHAPGFAARPPTSARTGKARAAFVLGLCSFLVGWVPFLCVLAIAAAVVALVLGISVLRQHRAAPSPTGDPGAGHGYAVAGVALAPLGLIVSVLGVWLSVVAIREVQSFADVGAYHTDDVTCSVADGTALYTGTITNDSGKRRSYEVTVEFRRDGTSTRVAIGDASVDDVDAGATAAFRVDQTTEADAVTCLVSNVTGPLPFGQS